MRQSLANAGRSMNRHYKWFCGSRSGQVIAYSIRQIVQRSILSHNFHLKVVLCSNAGIFVEVPATCTTGQAKSQPIHNVKAQHKKHLRGVRL
jgi:hypothetical protein